MEIKTSARKTLTWSKLPTQGQEQQLSLFLEKSIQKIIMHCKVVNERCRKQSTTLSKISHFLDSWYHGFFHAIRQANQYRVIKSRFPLKKLLTMQMVCPKTSTDCMQMSVNMFEYGRPLEMKKNNGAGWMCTCDLVDRQTASASDVFWTPSICTASGFKEGKKANKVAFMSDRQSLTYTRKTVSKKHEQISYSLHPKYSQSPLRYIVSFWNFHTVYKHDPQSVSRKR